MTRHYSFAGRSVPVEGWCVRTLEDGAYHPDGGGAWPEPATALRYATGRHLHVVDMDDAGAGRVTISLDAGDMLSDYARWCASQVLHLWDAPRIVHRYLETGDDTLSAAAWASAARAARRVQWQSGAAARCAYWSALWAQASCESLPQLAASHAAQSAADALAYSRPRQAGDRDTIYDREWESIAAELRRRVQAVTD